jgi:hypothetical protein
MDRPRFQVGIGTAMLAVVGIAISFAIAREFGALPAQAALAIAIQLVIYGHVRGLCRAEGRPYADADRARFQSLWRQVGIPTLVGCICLMYWLFPLVVHRR